MPPISNSMWQARMAEIEKPVASVSSKTLKKALEEEKKASEDAGEAGIKFSFDAGWQSRGSGRSYNSASGKVLIV